MAGASKSQTHWEEEEENSISEMKNAATLLLTPPKRLVSATERASEASSAEQANE